MAMAMGMVLLLHTFHGDDLVRRRRCCRVAGESSTTVWWDRNPRRRGGVLCHYAGLGRGEELRLRLCLHGGGAGRMELDDGVVVVYHSSSPSLPSRAWQI